MFGRARVPTTRATERHGYITPCAVGFRGRLPEDWKSYRLQASTVALIRAMRQSLYRQFLSYDELLVELATFYLHYHRILNSQVQRILEQELNAPPDQDDDKPA